MSSALDYSNSLGSDKDRYVDRMIEKKFPTWFKNYKQRSRRMHGLAHHSINRNPSDRSLQLASLITDEPTFSVDDASISDTLSISGFTNELKYFRSDKKSGYLEVKNSSSSMSKEVFDAMPTTNAETIPKVDCIFDNDNNVTSSDYVIQTSSHPKNDHNSSSVTCDKKTEMIMPVRQLLCHDIPANGLNPKTAELSCSLSSRNDLTDGLGTQGEHISRASIWKENATDSLDACVKTVISLSSSLPKEMATGNPEIREENLSSTYSTALNEKAAIIDSSNSKFTERIINYRSPDSDLLFETLKTSNHQCEVDDIEMHHNENVLLSTVKMSAPSTDRGQSGELKSQLDKHMDSSKLINSRVQTNVGCHTGQELISLPHLNYNGLECEINKNLAFTTPSLDGVESGIAHEPCSSLKNGYSLQAVFGHLQASGPAESESNLLYSVENAIYESTAYDSTKKNDFERINSAPCLGVIGPITEDVAIDEISPQNSSQDGFGGNSSKTISEKEVLFEHETKQEVHLRADSNCLGTEFQCSMKKTIAAAKLDCPDSETHSSSCTSTFFPGVTIPGTDALAFDDVLSEASLSHDYFGKASAKAANTSKAFFEHQTKQETELTDDSKCQANDCHSSLEELITASYMDDSDSETRVVSFDRDPCTEFIIPNTHAAVFAEIPLEESLSQDYYDDTLEKTACEKDKLSEHQTDKQGRESMSNSNFHGTEYEISMEKVIAATKVDGPNSEKHAVACDSLDAYASSISCGIISNNVDNISSPTLSFDVISSESSINISSRRNDSEDPHCNLSISPTNKSVILSSDVTSAATAVSQVFPVDSSGKSSINIWTNGVLLGLEPSKPPDITVPNAYSSDDISDERSAAKSPPRMLGSGNESKELISEENKLNIIFFPEQDNSIGKISDGQSDSLLTNQRSNGSIEASSFCKIDKSQTVNFIGTGSEVDRVQEKGNKFFSETDKFSKKELESTVSRLNGIGMAVDFSSLAHRFLLSTLQRKSPITGISSLSELMNNDVYKLHGINIHSKDKERPKRTISSAPLHKLSNKDSAHGLSEKPVSSSFDSSGCQSPPIEHMKVSFQMNESDVSKLNLEFLNSQQQGNIGNVVFPSFQLIGESLQPVMDGNLESDDDTFCRSCPYSSDDLLSLFSESDAEIWGQEEIDISYRIKATGSISKPIAFNDFDDCGVSQVNDIANLNYRNDE